MSKDPFQIYATLILELLLSHVRFKRSCVIPVFKILICNLDRLHNCQFSIFF